MSGSSMTIGKGFGTEALRSGAAMTTLAILAAALAGCASGNGPSVKTGSAAIGPEAPTIAADQLIGNWGLAAYREEKDIARTANEAKAACNNPYVIGRGPGGGPMMHLSDKTEPTELALKGASGGRNFIGPAAEPPGGPRDREITSFSGTAFVMEWVDPTVATRFGTMIFVRCSA